MRATISAMSSSHAHAEPSRSRASSSAEMPGSSQAGLSSTAQFGLDLRARDGEDLPSLETARAAFSCLLSLAGPERELSVRIEPEGSPEGIDLAKQLVPFAARCASRRDRPVRLAVVGDRDEADHDLRSLCNEWGIELAPARVARA